MCCNLQSVLLLDHTSSSDKCDSEESLPQDEIDSVFVVNQGMDASGELNIFLPCRFEF